MDETLHQLEGLLLGSVPTIFLFLFILVLYRSLVYGPLTRVLAERRARTDGAMEQASAAAAAAAAKAQEYEARLRAARLKIFQARQQRQQQWNRERESAMTDAQEAARRQVVEAKLALQAQADATRHTMEDSIEELAGEILQAVLPKGRATVGRVS